MTRVIIRLDHSEDVEGMVEEPEFHFGSLDEAIKYLIEKKAEEGKVPGKWSDPQDNFLEK